MRQSPSTRRPRWFAPTVCALVALHVAKALLFLAGGQAPLKWDSAEYWSMAKSLALGSGLPVANSVHRPPGYPAFLALHQILFDAAGHVAAVATQLLCVVLTALLTAWMCGRIGRSRVAFAVGLAVPLAWMEAPYLALYLLSDIFLAVLFTGFAASAVLWLDRPTIPRAALAGVLLGASVLVKPVAQLAWVPVLVAMVYRILQLEEGRRWRTAARHAGLLLLGLALVVGPWIARNHSVFGEAFLTRFTGRSLWYSCFTPTGAGLELPDTEEGRLVRSAAPGRERRPWAVFRGLVATGRSATESDTTMQRVAVQAIASEPGVFAASVADRYVKFWTTRKRHGYWKNNGLLTGPDSAPVRNRFEVGSIARWHGSTGDRLRIVGTIQLAAPLLALLGLLAMARVRELRPTALALFGLILYLSLAISVAILPMYRYRIPVDPLVIASAVGGGATLLSRRE